MLLKIDENLPIEVAVLFRDAGHDAVTVLEQGMKGAIDPNLAKACGKEGRVLVTLDTDFANIQNYRPSAHAGLVVLRLGVQSKNHVVSVVERMIPLLRTEDVRGRLWVVDEIRVRIHS